MVSQSQFAECNQQIAMQSTCCDRRSVRGLPHFAIAECPAVRPPAGGDQRHRPRAPDPGRPRRGKGLETERLVSRGYTSAGKALTGNCAAGDVGFHRLQERLGANMRMNCACSASIKRPEPSASRAGTGPRWSEFRGDWRPGAAVWRCTGPKNSNCARGTSPLDENRPVAGAGEQPDGRRDEGREGHGDVQAGRRRDAGIERRRQPTPSYRSGMSLNRARVPGPHGGHRDRGDGG